MLLNYLKLSLRLLARNPFFAGINVIGLSLGFTSFYVLWQYSTTELKSDQYHNDAEHIARLGVNWNWTDDGGKTWGHLTMGFSNPSLLPRLKEEFPEIESTMRILNQEEFSTELVNHTKSLVISLEDQDGPKQVFKAEKVVYADSNLFSFFSIPLVYGQPQHVLSQANYVALSESTAEKYFGKKDPTGELLLLNDTTTLIVSGVYEDLPHYSHLNFKLVISNVGLLNKWNTDGFKRAISYVRLNNGHFKDLETKLNQRINEYFAKLFRFFPNVQLEIFIQPLVEIPFSQFFDGDNFYPKSKPFLITLTFIALSVLALAWVNYINLSVTRTSRRFKEIATRKVSGAGSSDMIWQFVTESVVTNMLALALSVTLIQIIRTPVSFLFNIQVAEFSDLHFTSILIFVSIIITGILFSGLYPAIISMAHQPRALFNMGSSLTSKRLMPSLLTVSQLAIAIIFIMLGFTVSQQLNHILNMDTGIHSDQSIIIEAPVVKPNNYTTLFASLKKEISGNSNISAVTGSSFLINVRVGGACHTRRIGSDLSIGLDDNCIDEDFIPFYNLKIVSGRNFIKDDRPDGIIISRFAATRLGFNSPEQAVGSKINVSIMGGLWKDAEVIGVSENFRNTSFLNMSQSSTEGTNEGRGSIFFYKSQLFDSDIYVEDKVSVRISPQNLDETISSIERKFEQQFPDMPFTWYFLDEKMNEVYGYEKVARNQIVLFTVLALVIACLGLLGMISNKAVEKTREIGVRKVLGAQMHQVALILLSTTLKQTIIATFMGVPVAYYLTQQYLQKYSERIELQWWHFALPEVILVVILFVTVSSVLWKAARTNPVEALKYE